MEKDRLLKLAEHLENGRPGGHVEFYFGDWHRPLPPDERATPQEPTHCGTLGCAVGECPVLWPEEWAFIDGYPRLRSVLGISSVIGSAASFFGINIEDTVCLFTPGEYRWWWEPITASVLRSTASAEDVAESIRMYVAAVLARENTTEVASGKEEKV